jgi:hypothetical protein
MQQTFSTENEFIHHISYCPIKFLCIFRIGYIYNNAPINIVESILRQLMSEYGHFYDLDVDGGKGF